MSVNSVNGRGLESRFREKADNFHGSVKNIRILFTVVIAAASRQGGAHGYERKLGAETQ